MNANTIFVLIAYLAVSMSGLVLLKIANGVVTPAFVLGFALYGFGFVLWIVLLRLLPLSTAFPIAAGCLIIGTQFAGRIFFQESLSASHLVGIGMIVVGLCLIGFFDGHTLRLGR